ncbi:MAG: dihydropteroate synthase, partial [Chitinophagaceae bacterium]
MITINCKSQLINFDVPRVMGIINTTPDSFYKSSRHSVETEVLKTAERMLLDGASFLDLGGQSTRPGSRRVSQEEERARVIPAVESIAKHFPEAFISIDTFYASVASAAVEAGACMVNDVSGGSIDPDLHPLVAKLKIPYVLMHMQGNPETMQQKPEYNNVVLDVFDYLNFTINRLHSLGIIDLLIDPGFGFGKTSQHNFRLLSELSFFRELGRPLLVGVSRKG